MILTWVWTLLVCTAAVEGFVAGQCNGPLVSAVTFQSSALHAASTKNPQSLAERRKRLLSRAGPYFHLERASGAIEFGATADLVTTLESDGNSDVIRKWMADERGLALSIWDENMLQELGDSVYRLETMKLQFVTIQLAPKIDVKMVTKFPKDDPTLPVFVLQSIAFNPNIQLLPGLTVSAEDLGIEIEVSGEMRPSKDGKGVTGRVAFQTAGILPPPMRILPEQVLKAATNAIDQTIVDFAIKSFQKGAREQYRRFKAP